MAQLECSAAYVGSLLTAIRYETWYGKRRGAWPPLDSGGFRDNAISRSTADSSIRVGAMIPSLAKSVLIHTLDFPTREVPSQTYIFTGAMHVPEHRVGTYRFRVTVDAYDSVHMLVDNEVVLGVITDERNVSEVDVQLDADDIYQFEVCSNWRCEDRSVVNKEYPRLFTWFDSITSTDPA